MNLKQNQKNNFLFLVLLFFTFSNLFISCSTLVAVKNLKFGKSYISTRLFTLAFKNENTFTEIVFLNEDTDRVYVLYSRSTQVNSIEDYLPTLYKIPSGTYRIVRVIHSKEISSSAYFDENSSTLIKNDLQFVLYPASELYQSLLEYWPVAFTVSKNQIVYLPDYLFWEEMSESKLKTKYYVNNIQKDIKSLEKQYPDLQYFNVINTLR